MLTWIANIFWFVIALAGEACRPVTKVAKKFLGKWWHSHY